MSDIQESSEGSESPVPGNEPVEEGNLEQSVGEQSDAPPPVVNNSPGDCLREARAALGLTIADVAQSIKFSPRQIETLERNDFDKLPGATFVRGFIRSYAKLLRLDEQALLRMLDQNTPHADLQINLPEDTGAALPQPGEQRNYLPHLVLVVVLAALVLALFSFFDWPSKSDAPKPASNAPTVAAPMARIEQPPATRYEPGQPVPPSDPLAGPDIRQLVFVFEDKSWVEVKDSTQRVIFAQNNEPGTRQIVNGKPPFALVIGNSSRVQLQFEDRQIDLQPHTKVDVARLTLE